MTVPASGVSKPGDEPQQCRLPAAGRADDRGGAAPLQLQIDVVQHDAAVERLCEAADVDQWGGHSAATFVDWRNSSTVTGIANSTSISAYGAAAA